MNTVVTNKKLVLVDGSSYLFRAYHALPPLMTSTGIPTGAAYGVINMLRKLLNDEKPDYLGVIFDTKTKNFRHGLYPAYKANRTQMPEELSLQIEPLHEAIKAMGIPLLAIEGVEADDVIGTLAHQASQKKINTVISTGDKDLAQLVDHHINLINTMTGALLDQKNVLAKFGVRPAQIIDYLSLVGDPVDNIPGIPKVGPKTAAKWLQEYGTLEELVHNASHIKGKVGANLREHLAQLPLSKKLVTVQREIPLSVAVESLVLHAADIPKLKLLFEKMEFRSWLRDLDNKGLMDPVANPTPSEKTHYETISTEQQCQVWFEKIKQKKIMVLDTQTTNLNPLLGELVGIAIALEKGEAGYIPFSVQLTRTWVLDKLKPLLEDHTICKIGQNVKYDLHIFAQSGIKVQNIKDDIILQSYVLNSIAIRHDIGSLAQYYLHYKTILYEEVVGKGVKQITFDKVDVCAATQYAAQDADMIYRLNEVLVSQLNSVPTLLSVYRDIEMPLVQVLWKMEQQGICIDAQKLEQQSHYIANELHDLEEKAYILAGERFNLGSPKQLLHILYDKLGLPILQRTPTGAPSTAENVLQELSHDYELPRIIVQHRTLSKLKSTYTDKLPLQINPHTQRVHTTYQQAITATGRLSSTDPNLQNIPIRTQEGRKIRQAFIPSPGYVLLAADYSQIELRIMAHLSQDEGLLKAFCEEQDIHRYTASEVLGIPIDEVTLLQRRNAKAINFGLIYGMSAFGLARQLDIDRNAAQLYIDQYFTRYPGVKKYMETTRENAAQVGFVETLFKRRLYLPDIRSKHMGKKRAAERTAINAPMQGTAADIIKKAMIDIYQHIADRNDIRMLMQVHDELVFELKPSVVEEAQNLITHCMQQPIKLSVPLVVNVGIGNNWDEAH